ncbi:4Fe-4S single cluster domain-containing protein [Amycolatopsis mongoliensis]|uniref:4Fe-4S single cluster domain-containing protein n=1 Tax=Amycolatopsis mongoliensis TaxID=715475 RepID=A0A9Y2NKR0_9PSEU|nr:4Fe-4S single cluster domain-containing protein [Amycolatopsis sp. 4-36]WIY05309.1 4Fe-4S single cluster domain-containing protein [Amycolatopsis sp. 4-36]
MELLNLHRIVDVTAAEGPGLRCAVWTQGCSVRCPGCFNPQTWTTRGGALVPWQELVSRVLAIDGIEGVTLLGGEPFDQPEPLGLFAAAVREAGLSVMTFTGHVLEELPPSKLLDSTDLLVDGPFLADRPETSRPWVGSVNQRFHFLTDRYDESIFTTPNRLELTIAPDGAIELNGFATTEVLEALLEGDHR